MLAVLLNSWALLAGILLLLIGNGLQGTLLGIRGAIEGFDAATMSVVMSAYYLGFLAGSRSATALIQRVGHVRVFAALASLISAAFILYVAAPYPVVWVLMRLLVGFCFAGVYVVAESWLNDASTNETRGQALSLYMITQSVGIISAQGFVNIADPSGIQLFVLMSVLVSVSFAPILLSVSAAPAFQTTRPMTLVQLYRISPLGCVGTVLLGGVFSGTFGMAAVFGTERGLTVPEISLFVASIYVGALVLQYPIGSLSDRMDRRRLIIALTAFGALITFAGVATEGNLPLLLAVGFGIGGVSNPLYSLLIAYTNDFLDHADMAAASGGLLFLHGLGAITGPLALGYLMSAYGANAFFVFIAVLFGLVTLYGTWRSTQRAAPAVEDTAPYAPVLPTASPVALEVAQEVAIERAVQASPEPEVAEEQR
jgi:MFS family permease